MNPPYDNTEFGQTVVEELLDDKTNYTRTHVYLDDDLTLEDSRSSLYKPFIKRVVKHQIKIHIFYLEYLSHPIETYLDARVLADTSLIEATNHKQHHFPKLTSSDQLHNLMNNSYLND